MHFAKRMYPCDRDQVFPRTPSFHYEPEWEMILQKYDPRIAKCSSSRPATSNCVPLSVKWMWAIGISECLEFRCSLDAFYHRYRGIFCKTWGIWYVAFSCLPLKVTAVLLNFLIRFLQLWKAGSQRISYENACFWQFFAFCYATLHIWWPVANHSLQNFFFLLLFIMYCSVGYVEVMCALQKNGCTGPLLKPNQFIWTKTYVLELFWRKHPTSSLTIFYVLRSSWTGWDSGNTDWLNTFQI